MKNNNRILFFVIAATVLFLTAFIGHARKEYSFASSPAKTITLLVDSVDYRDDLTRMYGRLIGRPHTAQRIDKIELATEKTRYEATDIDGIDFTRWFQWEDEGVIILEIDFAPMIPLKSGILYITTPRGVEEITLNRNR